MPVEAVVWLRIRERASAVLEGEARGAEAGRSAGSLPNNEADAEVEAAAGVEVEAAAEEEATDEERARRGWRRAITENC
jgi:hypothetical protein